MNGYIYKITNLINNKSYIGKTTFTIEKRFKEHKENTNRYLNRPLYRAFRKYGVDNFSIEVVEEVDISELSNREIYWIEHYHTYSNGYNATFGGEGKVLYDYDLIAELISSGKTSKEICDEIGCCVDTVRAVAKKYGLTINGLNLFVESKIQVDQFTKNGEYCQTFSSYSDAAKWLENNGYVNGNLSGVRSHIGEVCRGKRKSAYGFIWKNKK